MAKSDRKEALLGNKSGNGGPKPGAGLATPEFTPVVANMAEGELATILSSLRTMRDGDFSVRLPGFWTGLPGKIADAFNDIAAANQQMAGELKRVGQSVGKEGKTSE